MRGSRQTRLHQWVGRFSMTFSSYTLYVFCVTGVGLEAILNELPRVKIRDFRT